MAQKATHLGPVGNFVKLQAEDVYNIYKLALQDFDKAKYFRKLPKKGRFPRPFILPIC